MLGYDPSFLTRVKFKLVIHLLEYLAFLKICREIFDDFFLYFFLLIKYFDLKLTLLLYVLYTVVGHFLNHNLTMPKVGTNALYKKYHFLLQIHFHSKSFLSKGEQ